MSNWEPIHCTKCGQRLKIISDEPSGYHDRHTGEAEHRVEMRCPLFSENNYSHSSTTLLGYPKSGKFHSF